MFESQLWAIGYSVMEYVDGVEQNGALAAPLFTLDEAFDMGLGGAVSILLDGEVGDLVHELINDSYFEVRMHELLPLVSE